MKKKQIGSGLDVSGIKGAFTGGTNLNAGLSYWYLMTTREFINWKVEKAYVYRRADICGGNRNWNKVRFLKLVIRVQ